MYRFRSIESLLGDRFRELEQLSIYFASPEQLNDPIEGFRDLFWKGDQIVWRNLFRHYILCLEHLFTLVLIREASVRVERKDIQVFLSEKGLPTDDYRDTYREILAQFLSGKVLALANGLSRRKSPIRRNELLFFLSVIHPFAMKSINEVFVRKGLMSEILTGLDSLFVQDVDLVELMNKLEEQPIEISRPAEIASSISRSFREQVRLLAAFNAFAELDKKHNWVFLTYSFPEEYLSSIEKLVFPDWYAACFMDNCRNSSVWGHYGDNHRGVCLKFKPMLQNGDNGSLRLQALTDNAKSESTGRTQDFAFRKMTYENTPIEVDFFRSLGRLSEDQIHSQWYIDEGKLSECAEGGFSEEWRQSYWSMFYNGITRKLKDWEYEKEYRLVLEGGFYEYGSPEKRVFRYNFEDLDGIIFGLKTSFEDKLKILKIVEQLCVYHKRTDFTFYQAEHAVQSGCIEYHPMRLLKVEL